MGERGGVVAVAVAVDGGRTDQTVPVTMLRMVAAIVARRVSSGSRANDARCSGWQWLVSTVKPQGVLWDSADG